MSWVEDWTVVAACRGMDPDELFVQGAAQNRAKTVCSGCPVRTECLADALDNRVEYGVWGGMTERERRALLRRRPEVRSWRQFLEAAKENYERNGAERTGGDLNTAAEVEARFAAATQAAIPRQRSEAGSFGRA
ncbi:WhiB family redox-sensing transcriptional regulator [Catenulispora sp. GAS73]|uniref:WhiB family transcriptional regulator n=1 Tax=Catenulispora sp. GAS73 TaxID=3156269 RepID=UPI003510D474